MHKWNWNCMYWIIGIVFRGEQGVVQNELILYFRLLDYWQQRSVHQMCVWMGNKSPGYKPERWCHSFGPIGYNLDTDILACRHEFHVETYNSSQQESDKDSRPSQGPRKSLNSFLALTFLTSAMQGQAWTRIIVETLMGKSWFCYTLQVNGIAAVVLICTLKWYVIKHLIN